MVGEIVFLILMLSVAFASTSVQFFRSASVSSLPIINSFSTFTIHEKNPLLDLNNLNLLTAQLNHVPHFENVALPAHWDFPSHSGINGGVPNHLDFKVGRDGHITPDFSNGLDYPDPYLLTGFLAQRIAKLLYSRELFYGDIPHYKAIMQNQKQRRQNGLDGNRLGSLNPRSPFYRKYQPLSQFRRLS